MVPLTIILSKDMHLTSKLFPKKIIVIFFDFNLTMFSSYSSIVLNPSIIASLFPFNSKLIGFKALAIWDEEKF